ncbi:MAG TPA: acyltransferase, partial [Terracidiphilus sp.]|nr:acyltransferase [Terracidiphilus sp.]
MRFVVNSKVSHPRRSTMSQTLSAPHKNHRIPTLDGWRAIAIAMVLVAHFGPGTRAFDIGKQGVGIFFVLSGYLITTNLLRERSKSGAINLKNFYLRRFFRLMPVAWTLLAITLIFGATDGREIASCVFFYRNFLIHPRTLVTSHFWSLSIEEQFYLAWPCVLVLAPRRARLFAILAASALAVYRFSLPLSFLNAHFGWTQFHADALLIGCAFALTPKIPRMPAVVFWISAIVVAVCTHFFPSFPPFGESVLIGWMIQTTARGAIPAVQKALNWRPVAQIGVMSYSLYVWQTPF